jgi:aminoglycoside phosphotransferase (APT) family kinase protein
MARRRVSTDWSGLCRMIESSLRGQPGFGNAVRVGGKLRANHDGFCHDHYFFTAGGQELMLRLARRFRSLRTEKESMELLPREAETLRGLANCRLPYPVPRLVCLTTDDRGRTIGLIESCLQGVPLSRFEGGVNGRSRLEIIAGVAAAVHQLPKGEFAHLPACPDSASHVRAELEALSPRLFAEWPAAAAAREWITTHVTSHPATVLHGDLLPQNLLWDFMGDGRISVIDWESARIGDPAYDLSIVTRGARQPLRESGGFQRLLGAYNEATGASLPASAVHIHELLLHLRWLDDAAQAEATGRLEGHGPEQYAQKLQAMLRRFASPSPPLDPSKFHV